MSKHWHILVVQDDEHLNGNIVNSLQKDGYFVQGVTSGAEAIRLLWSEEYDVVISDQIMSGADSFELLQWIRTYRPSTRMIMVAGAGSSVTRTQALENGVVSYLEKPLDLYILKQELRRLLQQTGFSASLDSFDLLDVIQIVNMSHKTIAMVVDTGSEEQGLLGFQAGELVWAEYGLLRGEEAFFALAAHKNGTVTHQPWNVQIRPNVTQPLSHLIFQALQYRSKYAAFKQLTGEQVAVAPAGTPQSPIQSHDIDDSPFRFVEPILADAQPQADSSHFHETPTPVQQVTKESVEWWQEPIPHERSHKLRAVRAVDGKSTPAKMPSVTNGQQVVSSSNDVAGASSAGNNITPSTVRKTPAGQRTDLPSWLIDQPTQIDMRVMRPSPLNGTGQVPAISAVKAPPAEWQPNPPPDQVAEPTSNEQKASSQNIPIVEPLLQQNSNVPMRQQSSSEWQSPESIDVSHLQLTDPQNLQLQSLASERKTDDLFSPTAKRLRVPKSPNNSTAASRSDFLPGDNIVATDADRSSTWQSAKPGTYPHSQRKSKRNYSALVAALQTLAYSIPGFIATAIVSIDGQPVAQVAVDDIDISQMCGNFNSIMQSMLLSLDQGAWGKYKDTIITSLTHHILLRLVGDDREAFQVLITTHESDPMGNLEVMANAEAAIESAL